jgi:NTE family protein
VEEFWRRVKSPQGLLPQLSGVSEVWSYWSTLLGGISGFFKPNPLAFWSVHFPWGVDHAAFYSTASLRETLAELVDFSIINTGSPRLTVGAANVQTSMMPERRGTAQQ